MKNQDRSPGADALRHDGGSSVPDAATGEDCGTSPPATFTDGIGSHRCKACGSLLRGADNLPRVAVRVDDLEEIACLLVDYVDCPAVWAPTIERLERAVGRTVVQMKADARTQYRDAIERRVDAND